MTVKRTYDFMKQVRNLEYMIIRRQAELDSLHSCLLPAGIRYDKDRVQTSPEDRMLEIAAKIDKLEREITTLQCTKAKKIVKISAAFEKLEDEREKSVLTLFYLNKKSMEEVADIMGYSVQRVYQIRKSGALKVSKILGK